MTPSQLHQRFTEIWGNPPGLRQLMAVNHTTVGLRFIVTAFIFFLIGGLLAMLIRSQLAVPDNTVLDHQAYNQLFTMHGTTMMFLFGTPIVEGLAIYMIPKMIGARDLIFPRVTAFGYWCYLFGGIFLYSSFLVGAAPDSGWFMYVPLSGAAFSPGPNSDFWLLGVTFVEISAIATAIELVVGILKTRAPGMAIHRMPLFVWAILVTAFMIVVGFPPLILASILLEIERAFDLPYFDVARGGDPLLWQHLFWLFGHPEVYILFLPAAGVISTVVPTFARYPLVGYGWIVLATLATGFLGFGLWVHHMYTVGIPHLALSFFAAASMAIAIPNGIQVFSWIATLWMGKPIFKTPLLFILGFFFIFVLGGLTGVMLALVPFDWQVHDTHFVVAHFHYVLIGGLVFPLFAGLYYWLPHFSDRLFSEHLGRWTFWLIFIGFNVTFLPMHLTGLLGMPRRVYTYPSGLGWDWLNLISTVGGFIISIGILVFIIDFFLHFRYGRPTGKNPWKAATLEWIIRTPVPPYNFISIPPVQGRYPLWDKEDLGRDVEQGAFFLSDPSSGRRETLGTSILEAKLEQIVHLPGNTWIPLITALMVALFFVGFLIQEYILAACGAGFTIIALLIWQWQWNGQSVPDNIDAGNGHILPFQYVSTQAPGWWGLVMAILADTALLSSLIYAYFFLWTVSAVWPPPGYENGNLLLAVIGLSLLLISSGIMIWAKASNISRKPAYMKLGLVMALLLGVAFMIIQLLVLQSYGFQPQEHIYPSLIYTITGFHLVHIGIGLLMIGFTITRSWRGYVNECRSLDIRITALFWHYTVILWVVSFMVIHLFPLLT